MDTELLLEGAKKLAAGQALGLSPDQTLAMLQRAIKLEQQRANRGRANPNVNSPAAQFGPGVTEAHILEQMLKANAAAGEAGPAELQGRSLRDTGAVDAVIGQNQDDFQQLIANDREAGRSGRQASRETWQSIKDAEEQKRLGQRVEGSRRDAQGNRIFDIKQTGYQPSAREVMMAEEGESGVAGVREALQRLRRANDMTGSGGLEGAAAIEGSLEDSLRSYAATGSENVQRNADASLGRELIRRDNQRFDPVSPEAKWNNVRAAQEARVLGAAMGEIITDTDAAAKARYRGEGYKGQNVLNAMVSAQERSLSVPAAGAASDIETREGLYVDPMSGSPLAMDEPATTAIAGANTPDTAQMVNAPKASSAISWVAKSVPAPRVNANSGGDLPQVDINVPTQLFADRLRQLGSKNQAFRGLQGISSNVRSVEEFEKAINYVVDQGQAQNMRWRQSVETVNPDGTISRSFKQTQNPGADEVMTLLRYTPAEKKALAGALYQLELAKDSGVDNSIKDAYFARQTNPRDMSDVAFNAKEAMINPNPGEAQAPIARIGGGAQLERQRIAPQLNALSNPDARDDLMGQVQGEKARVWRRAPFNVDLDEVDAHFLQEEQVFASKNKAPVNTERARQKATKAKIAMLHQQQFEDNQKVAAEVEKRGMQEAQSDFNKMVKAERTNRGSRIQGRIF